ncbi:acetate--CoA ligase family protein [Acidobacteriota bacterium]
MDIDFEKIETIFRSSGDLQLLEHEFYQVLHEMGLGRPEYFLVPKGGEVTQEGLDKLPADRVVIKIISPLIIHKSDVKGVQFVQKNVDVVNATIEQMVDSVPGNFLNWAAAHQVETGMSHLTIEEVREQVFGVLVSSLVRYRRFGFGSEFLVGIRTSREFGPVVTMGLGGIDVEYLADRIREGQDLAIASPYLVDRHEIKALLERLSFYDKLVRPHRGRSPRLSSEKLIEVYFQFMELARHFSPYQDSGEYVIEEAEVNPFVIHEDRLIPLDAVCRISQKSESKKSCPFENIKFLLKPENIGIIGVSEKMNLGHIILENILKNGFDKEKVYVVKRGLDRIEGCLCVSAVSDLPETVDMFVLAVGAEQSLEVMRDLVNSEKARSVIIIAGGIGEKEGTEDLEQQIKNLLGEARKQGTLTPVVNGGNCLGIFSRPGSYDTTFIPDYKLYDLPRKGTRESGLVILSQSGAFMISLMSKIPSIVPTFAVSIGNQIDLTLSDYMNYFREIENIQVLAVYAEGFLPGDGLAFAQAARELVRQGKSVVTYKAGRSPEGQTAMASHTASVAGDYRITKAVLEQAGVIVEESISQFETTVKNLLFLKNKKIKGNRTGLISNAGFECVIMSDNLKNDYELELAQFSTQTQERLQKIMLPLGIDRLQDIHNPVDITPVANDEVFCQAVEAILDDPDVDCAVISPMPMSPAMNTLPPSDFHREDLCRPGSTPLRLIEIFRKTDKPFVISIDTGEIYRPMRDLLEDNGIPIFSHCDAALGFLRKFIGVRRSSSRS